MPDTWRGDCLSCASHPVVQTPNVDLLAGEGIRFSRAYTTSPVCMPARSSFHTGLFCHNHGQWGNYAHCPTDTDNYATLLRRSGYHTCHVGKSHLYGHGRGDHLECHKPFMNALGWNDVLEVTGPYATRHTDSIMTDHWRQVGCLDTFRDDYARRVEAGPRSKPWPSPMPAGETIDDFVGRTAVRYIEDYRRDEPLLLFVGFGGPHDPFDPPAEWAARYNPAGMPPPLPGNAPPAWATPAAAAHQRTLEGDAAWVTPEVSGAIRSHYYAKVSHIDWWIGRVVQALQDRRMWQDTSVVFWSDHGDMLCDKGRIHKSVFYQGSADVPLIVRPAPAVGMQVQRGSVCESLVSLVDGMPTIAELAGCEAPEGGHGRSLLPLLTDPTATIHDAVFSEIDHRTMIRTDRHKMVVDGAGRTLKLYDMQEDPTESRNLAGRPDMDATVAALRERMLLWHLATPSRREPNQLNREQPRGR